MIWTLQFVGERPPTMNRHRMLHPHKRAQVDKHWRQEFARLASEAGMPALTSIDVTAIPLHSDRRSPQDVAACCPAVKAAVDGLVDAGVIPDDDGRYFHSLRFLPPVICGENGLQLVIEGRAAA